MNCKYDRSCYKGVKGIVNDFCHLCFTFFMYSVFTPACSNQFKGEWNSENPNLKVLKFQVFSEHFQWASIKKTFQSLKSAKLKTHYFSFLQILICSDLKFFSIFKHGHETLYQYGDTFWFLSPNNFEFYNFKLYYCIWKSKIWSNCIHLLNNFSSH